MGLGGRPLPPPPPNAAARAGESNTEWILGVIGLFCSLALLAICLRVYVRAGISKVVGWDDYVMVGAGLTTLAAMICFGVQASNGLGKHYEARTKDQDTTFQFAAFLQAIIGLIPGLAILKVSIGLSLLRLNKPGWYSYALYILLGRTLILDAGIMWGLTISGFVVFSELFGSFTIIFFCNPVRGYWDGSVKPKCYPIPRFVAFGVAHTGMNIFSDVMFATIPVPIIWSLQMKLRTRIYLIAIFSLGYVAVAMGVVRAVYQIGFTAGPDSAFLQRVQFWGFLQLTTGIIAACAPTLKPLVGRWLNIASTMDPKYYGTGGSGPPRGHTGYIMQRTPVGPDYELENRRRTFTREEGEYHASIKGGDLSADTYSKTGSFGGRSGSEEMILPVQDTKGIMRTTEVKINNE